MAISASQSCSSTVSYTHLPQIPRGFGRRRGVLEVCRHLPVRGRLSAGRRGDRIGRILLRFAHVLEQRLSTVQVAYRYARRVDLPRLDSLGQDLVGKRDVYKRQILTCSQHSARGTVPYMNGA